MGRYTRMTAFLLIAAMLINLFALPVSASQSASDGVVILEEPTEETTQETTAEEPTEATEAPAEEPTEATEAPAEEPTEATEAPTEEPTEASEESDVMEIRVAGDNQRFTLDQLALTVVDEKITIHTGNDLIKLSHANPEEYKNLTLEFAASTNTPEFDATKSVTVTVDETLYELKFVGLDSFAGTIFVQSGSENFPVKLTTPLFNTLSDQATIQTYDHSGLLLLFAAKTEEQDNPLPSALLAATVTTSGAPAATAWELRVAASDENGIMPPLIGRMNANAQVKLSLNLAPGEKPAVKLVKGTGNAGLLCAGMETGASLTLSSLTPAGATLPAVTTTAGNAGSLVGTMASGAELVLGEAVSLQLSNVTASESAGGLVGSATDIKLSQIPDIHSTVTISGADAGGLIGSYTNTGAVEGSLRSVTHSISGITVSGGNTGGVFGTLSNAGTFTFDSSATVNTTLISNNYAGGLIGQYSAASLKATLKLTPGSVTSSVLRNEANAYGGLVGYVSGNDSAYIEAMPTAAVTVKGTAKNYGGLIGSLSDHGHYLKVGNVTITNSGDIKGTTTAGGVVGFFGSGVLELSGAVTAVTPTCDKNFYRGNYVGQRGNTLVFTTYQPEGGWTFNGNACNDIGSWGQVLQVYEGSGLNGLLTVTDHTVTVTGTGTTVHDQLSFAQAALRFQLDPKGALIINNDFNLNDVTLSVSGNIDLNGTGLTGFQRDDSKAARANATLNCENATIIFPDITIYGGAENNDNVAHNRQGLFAETGDLTITNAENSKLTLQGSISVNTFQNNAFLGALTAKSYGNVNATNVICHTNLTITGNCKEERISGLVAQQNGGTVTFTGCEWASDIDYDGSNICYLGGLLARAENETTVNVKNCTIKGSITKTGNGECYVGGLVASLRDNANGSWKNSLTINGLTADGVTINTENSTKTGGILGWEWMTEQADIQGVTVKNCTLKAGSDRFGGLVYKGSGYWKVHDTGIKLESNNSFTGTSSIGSPSGLLLAAGCKLKDHSNALYLEIQNGAYTIAENSVTLNIGGSTVFDEIVGETENAAGNGIVSIGTGIDINTPAVKDCNYVKQLTIDYENPNTRYYYNLDVFRTDDKAASGPINTAGKLVLYSAFTHCFEGLREYFYSNPGTITGPINLTGYSYYPAEAIKTIQDATITFDYQGLESGVRKPSDAERQNYGMHTGLFTDVEISQTATSAGTLRVNALTLSGTVGGSALVCGNAQGGNTNAKLNLVIETVTLNNLRIYPSFSENTVAPLLIDRIGSFTTLNMKGVEASGYSGEDNYAASSLIGRVGSETGSHIQLTFSDMALSGIRFSRAWFLESFQYSSDSSGVYNFRQTDGYTLGQELSNTDRAENEQGPSGRNNGEQYCFFEDETTVCSVVGGEDADPATFFSNYLRYVYSPENGANHELDINLSRSGLTEGCGTYNDPYIIRTAKQLGDLARALSGVVAGMKIQVDTGVLNGNTLNAFNQSHAEDATDTHRVYTGNSDGWNGDGTTVTAANMQLYLRNAYYSIMADDIVLSNEWTGLGADSNSAFCGVIDGMGNAITITAGSSTQFGGLIKFSMGSVVKNLTINYTANPTVNCQGIPSNTSNASFFGGVVGWCLGGDTILDNVSVTGLSAPGLDGTNPYLASVGGYVGMVGGAIIDGSLKYGGGVVFRNTVSEMTLSGPDNYFYVNPYVGRVLDGYAVSETQTLDNTDRNYWIPCISSGTHLTLADDNTIQVSDDTGLWLLSAIVNSGAGAMQNANCLAYTTGKARTGAYGDTMDAAAIADEAYLGGRENKTKTASYLSRYVSGNFHEVNSTGVSISLTGNCDMSGYGNGFRGIGGCYGIIDNADRLLKVTSIASSEGSRYTITLKQNRMEYTDEYQTWATLGAGLFPVLNPDTSFTAQRLILAGTTGITYYKYNNGSLKDAVNPIPGDKKLMDADRYRLGCAGAGLLAGTMKKATGTTGTMSLNDITVSGNVNGSATFAGGLIGLACINHDSAKQYISSISVENCNYRDLSVEGFACVGGFFGYAYADTISITANSDYPMEGITVKSSEAPIKGAKTGIGALIGRCGVKDLTICGDENKPMVFSGLTITNQNTTTDSDRYFTGGLAGLLGIRDNATVRIQNIELTGIVSISNKNAANSSGILAGLLIRYNKGTSFSNDGFDWNNGGNVKARITNIAIAQSENDSVTVKNTKQGGALFGCMMIASAELDRISIGSDNAKVTLASETNNSNVSLGGLFGTVAKAEVTVDNATLTGVNVWGQHNDNNRGSALLFGYADNKANFTIRNAKLKNCNLAVYKGDTNANAGIIFAELKSATVNGYNILIDGCTVGLSLTADNKLTGFTADTGTAERIGLKVGSTYKPYSEMSVEEIKSSSTSNYFALFGGNTTTNASDNIVKLVGVSVQNCHSPMKDIGRDNQNANSYIIRADYTGACMGEFPNTDGANPPYVTINPVSPLKIPGMTITGDGAVFEEGKKTPLLSKIQSEDKYYNIATSKSYLQSNSAAVTLTHFADPELNTFGGTDFPVVVLETNSSDEANRCLYSIISMLTNWELCTESGDSVAVKQGSFYTLSVVSYKWNGSAFAKQDNQSLKVVDNRFYLIPGGYDNKLLQFTLVDVAYKDPSSDFVYHLYIPVVVKKVFVFKFWASATLGTSYKSASYSTLSQPVLASYGESVTVLLNYEYQWTKEEWEDAMARDLLWNFDLGVTFESYYLPPNTRLTLVDRNDRDRAYYATTSGEKSVNFKNFTDGASQPWSNDLFLCDYLKLTATANDKSGRFYRLGKTKLEGATIRDVDGYYYKPATEETGNLFDLTITALDDANPKITVQFYLTLFTPANASGIVNLVFKCADSLTGKLPNKRYEVAKDKEYVKNDKENNLVLGNFFTTKETSVTTSRADEKMTDINTKIPLVLKTKISFTSEEAKQLYKTYGYNQRLFQKFDLTLREYPGGSPREFVRGTQINVQYKLGDTDGASFDEVLMAPVSSYPLEFYMKDEEEPGISADKLLTITETTETTETTEKNVIVLTAEVTLTYSAEARMEQFPTREEEEDGIAIVSSSTLAYNLDFLRNSTNHGEAREALCGEKAMHFYREDTGTATLHYFSYENLNGAPAESVSELGINGLDGSSFEIHTEALYNVSNVKDAGSANQLRVTIALLEKKNSEIPGELKYQKVTDLEGYLSSLTVGAYYKQRGGSGMTAAGDERIMTGDSLKEQEKTLYFALDKLDTDVQLRIPITLMVRTGEGFTGRYANYRILVTAELLKEEQHINSLATDYVVYTNAKICKSFIDGLADSG